MDKKRDSFSPGRPTGNAVTLLSFQKEERSGQSTTLTASQSAFRVGLFPVLTKPRGSVLFLQQNQHPTFAPAQADNPFSF